MQVKSTAIVFSIIKYGESDLIVKCFTQENGMLSFIIKGIRKTKKGKLKTSFFQPLSILDLEYTHRNNKNLHFIKEARPAHNLYHLQTNIYKSAIAIFLAEVLNTAIQEEEANASLFAFLKSTIVELENTNNFANLHLFFLVNLTKFLGFYPDTSEIEFPYFNLTEGKFQLKPSTEITIEDRSLQKFKAILQSSDQAIKMTQKDRNQCIALILRFYEIHLSGFRSPKSYQILKELF
ncbi:MAG: DNA repair protein RecO [Bacteroidota bacterium]